jgi:hypothetical protein
MRRREGGQAVDRALDTAREFLDVGRREYPMARLTC